MLASHAVWHCARLQVGDSGGFVDTEINCNATTHDRPRHWFMTVYYRNAGESTDGSGKWSVRVFRRKSGAYYSSVTLDLIRGKHTLLTKW